MNNTIDMDFIKLMVEKKDCYYISLTKVFSWFMEPYSFRLYISNVEYKKAFDAKYLDSEHMVEAGGVDDLDGDYMFKSIYYVPIPCFSSNGFKSLCDIFGTSKTQYTKNVFNLVESTYFHVINEDYDIQLNVDGSSRLIGRIRELFLKALIIYNNKPIR